MDSSLSSLNLVMWGTEPQGKPSDANKMHPFDYFTTYNAIEDLWEERERTSKYESAPRNPLPNESPQTAISVCRGLLRQCEYNDHETQYAMITTSGLARALPWDFLNGHILQEVADVLWRRLKVSKSGRSTWPLLVASSTFFE